MKYSYRVSTDYPAGIIYRKEDNGSNLDFTMWSAKQKKWVSSEEACDAFIGIGKSKLISEEEAMNAIGEA